jgi:hypothetical protein
MVLHQRRNRGVFLSLLKATDLILVVIYFVNITWGEGSAMSIIRDISGNMRARIENHLCRDVFGNRILDFRGDRLYDTYGNYLGEFRGDHLYDNNGNRMGELRNGGKHFYDTYGNLMFSVE